VLNQEIIKDVSSKFGSGIHLSPTIFWLLFLAVLAITAFQSAIIVYHWYVYAPNRALGSKMLVLYTVVTVAFFTLAVFGGLSLIISNK
jgi:hypothetical protein